ncbi:hypothetical protein BC835DRAFT_1382749 [Cytidiella melzeri]|nr:hypothetical protein BC835DRAFT_1382749 [Cytidiella melzeri]
MILDMKHQLNALSPTAILPPELLAEVFINLAQTNSTMPRPEQRLGGPSTGLGRASLAPYAWLTATHVCHHWRAVALRAPQLWSIIWITRVDCVREMLQRSKQVPLTIKADNLQGRVDALELVMRELPRIVCFDAKMPPHLPKRQYRLDAPRLKELVLQSTEAYELLLLGTSQLQSHFALCEMPLLEKLEIYSFQVQWTNQLLKPTLRHLTLHAARAPTPLDIEDILRVLENLPLLETLDLRACLPHPGANETVLRVVDLANLQKLCLHTSAVACSQFLRHTSFPTHVSMSLNCQIYATDELLPILSTIFARLDRKGDGVEEVARAPPLRTLSLCSTLGGHGTQLRGWPTYHHVDQLLDPNDKKLPDPFIDIAVRHDGAFPLFFLLRALLMGDIESLALHPVIGAKRIEKCEWTGTFEQFSKLRELGLGGFAKDHVHQILDHRVPCCAPETETEQQPNGPNGKERKTKTKTKTKTGRRRKQYCMPNLSALSLNSIFVNQYRDAFLDRLQKSLDARKKAKTPLEKLVFRNCTNVNEGDAEALKKSVGTVDWAPVARPYMHEHDVDTEWSDEEEDEEDEEYYGPMSPDFGVFDHFHGFYPFFDDFSEDDSEGEILW